MKAGILLEGSEPIESATASREKQHDAGITIGNCPVGLAGKQSGMMGFPRYTPIPIIPVFPCERPVQGHSRGAGGTALISQKRSAAGSLVAIRVVRV